MAGYGMANASALGGINAQAELAMMRGRGAEISKSMNSKPHDANGRANSYSAMEKTAQDFEAMFLGQMLQPMFEALPTDGLTGGGTAEGMWRSLLVDEYGKNLAKQGGVGIADHVLREMIRLQEAEQ